MPSRSDVVESVRGYVRDGVRYRKQGRSLATGLDCAGVVVHVGWELGLIPRDFDVKGYRENPMGFNFTKHFLLVMDPIPIAVALEAGGGDALIFRATVQPCHTGIFVEGMAPSFVHGSAVHGRVFEEPLSVDWMSRVNTTAFRFRGLSDG